MKQSQIFSKSKKSSKEFESINASLLIKAGFIDQVMAGVYTFLPLGLRVLNKIENIVREEMNKIGNRTSEVFMPTLAPIEFWKQTGRLDSVDVLMRAVPANKAAQEKSTEEYVIGPTHEEIVTPLAKKQCGSYKDLPFGIYQIQSKFRNEARPKAGLMRGREFRMKDLYSFHKDEKDLEEYFEKVRQAYVNVYKRLGLGEDTFYTAASGGDFCEDYSYEFQTKIENGEDTIFYVKSQNKAFNKEVAPSKTPTPQQDLEQKEKAEIFGEGIIGVEDLSKLLKISPQQTSKTLIYETDQGVIVASVRGDYGVNEDKLRKAAKVKGLKLASAETVKKITGAGVGYAGVVGLPKDIPLFVDDSLEPLVNFETGANKTNYHSINVNWNRDLPKPERFYDIKTAKEGDMYPDTEEAYEVFKASEVGNIFKLNTKFSKAFDYSYTDDQGIQKPVYMGCYGIGTSRLMGVLVEKFNDDKGMMWPKSVSPFQVHFLGLNLDNVQVKQQAEATYEKLLQRGIEVLYDDRERVSAGEKFSDTDLIGIPLRWVMSEKTKGKIEVKFRTETVTRTLDFEDALKEL